MVRAALLRDAPGAVVGAGVPAGQRIDRNAGTGVGRVDEPPAAQVQADVSEAVEEEEVPGREAAERHALADLILRRRIVRQLHAEVLVHVAGEAGAVETAARS